MKIRILSTGRLNALPAAAGLLLLMFSACNDGKRDIGDYYFPIDDLNQGLVYAYSAEEGDTTDRLYWYYRYFPRDSGMFLAATQYDRNFEITQIVREKIVKNGSLARNCYLYVPDTATGKSIPIPTEIESNNLFPFRVTDSLGVFLFRLSYHPLEDTSATIYLIRNRRFLGDGPAFSFEGKDYPAVRFSLREVVGHDQAGAAEVEGHGEEWYAKGLGLVYFRKSFGENNQLRYAYRLTERFTMQELERRAAQQ